MLADEFNTTLGNLVRRVAGNIAQFILHPPIKPALLIDVGKQVNVAGDKALELIKTLFARVEFRIVADMPFAKHAGGISGALEQLGHGFLLEAQTGMAVTLGGDHTVDTTALLVTPGE